jgi:hypothetical protein
MIVKDVPNFTATLAKEVDVGGGVAVKPFLVAYVESNNRTVGGKGFQIAIDRTQTDIGDFQSYAFINHVSTGVVTAVLQVAKDGFPLTGLALRLHRTNSLCLIVVIITTIIIIHNPYHLSSVFLKKFKIKNV